MKITIRAVAFLALLAQLFKPSEALSARISVLLGPPSLGQGGSNPVSVPPLDPIEWQASYIGDTGREWMLSVIPGIYYGQRFAIDPISIGLGGGLLISTSGVGLGLYQSLGWASEVFWKRYRGEVEYRQVIGYSEGGAEFPYSIRLGVSYEI